MILKLKESIGTEDVNAMAEELQAFVLQSNGSATLVTTSKMREVPEAHQDKVDEFFVFDSDIQLANKNYRPLREIKINDNVTIGGETKNSMVITGPCSVESEDQILQSAELCNKLGVKILRAGCYKPRTSPYTFQGMGLEGLKLLDKMREKYGLAIITEVRDATHVDDVIAYADIIQIGAKAMYDHGILKRCGKTEKPVLLKRGFGSTLQEFAQAAEFILSGGNEDVMLCERGIRTFETKTRFTLDLTGVAFLKEHTNLPIVLDPTHAMGYSYGVPDLARACMAMGIDGLLIETHPTPEKALSDAAQQLNHEQFSDLYASLGAVANSVGYNIV